MKDLDSLLEAADLVVCNSGLTLINKCIAFGKKMVLIPIPLHGEQNANALRAEELGVARVINPIEFNAHILKT